jgi:predicted dinucleotide-binding enzyme
MRSPWAEDSGDFRWLHAYFAGPVTSAMVSISPMARIVPGIVAFKDSTAQRRDEMRIGVLGSGEVGGGIARKLKALGHDVMVGSPHAKDKAKQFPGIGLGTVEQTIDHGDWLVNAMPGEASEVAFKTAKIDEKILIDVANLEIAVDQPIKTPLAEVLQKQHPKARVVKTLNFVSAHLMVEPKRVKGATVCVAGDDAGAKKSVAELLQSFGWEDVIDLGDLSNARAMEQLIPLWMSLEKVMGGPGFALGVVREK